MPKISVVMPTMRIGGLDVVCNSLQKQTFDDFELVIADGLYQQRKDLVKERAKNYKFPIRHVEPIDNPFPLNAFCRYANTGLIHASGEVLLTIVDYTWLPAHCLQVHDQFHSENRGYGLLCPHRYLLVPPLARPLYPDQGHYSDAQSDRYADDVKSGKLDDLMWSIFQEELTDISHLQVDMYGLDPKFKLPDGPATYAEFFAKNESMALEDVLEVNGWDEDLDGTHAYQDWDLSVRMTGRLGTKWIVYKDNVCSIVNPRKYLPHGKRIRPMESNGVIFHQKIQAGHPIPNSWNLRQKRGEL